MMLSIVLIFIALMGLIPAAVLFIQTLMALTYKQTNNATLTARPPVAVLIPAHNESSIISETLLALKSQLLPEDRLVVVADNCSDNTAQIAAAHGAEVLERHDTTRRGKGFALDFGVRYLEKNPPSIVIIVDADCLTGDQAINTLADRCQSSGLPQQALYLMKSPKGSGLKTRIAEFAWIVKNWVRPLGYFQLGLPCQLMGTGMAFPWDLIKGAALANAEIVEDMKLGIDLAIAGKGTEFCVDALVTSTFPESSAEKSQRTRWEHGHLSLILSEAPRIVMTAILKADLSLLSFGLDLAVPPLALLIMCLGLTLLVSGVGFVIGLSFLAFVLSLISLIMVLTSVAIAWAGWGRRVASLSDLIAVPSYLLMKLPLYFAFWFRRQKEWVRTKRD